MMTQPCFKHISDEHRKEDNIKEFIDSVPSGSTFYDLGANLGWFSIYAASKNLKVFAFEVDEFNYLGLQENVDVNNDFIKNNINIFNKGIADKKRKINLRSSNQIIGGHHKTLDLENFNGPSGIVSNKFIKEIEVTSLDEFIEENNLPWPEYLKVDIDGSEYAFLQGAQKTLSSAKAIVIEFCITSDFYLECQKILNSYNFKLTGVYHIPGWPEGSNFVYRKVI